MSAPLAGEEMPHPQQPRAERHRVMLGATIERFGGTGATRHRVRDLSATGVRVDQAERLQRGATVLVTVGALAAIGATVIWVERGVAGLRFVEPINPDDARAHTFAKPDLARGVRPGTSGWLGHLRGAYDR